jgi:tripartite-type tricarboxylate transporter receptor subunit TctC
VITRRSLLIGGALLTAPRIVRASGMVTLMVGARQGTAADREARAFLPQLARHLPGAIEIRNMHGDAGMRALRAVADAPRDGSVLGWTSTPSLAARMVDRGADELLPRLALLGAVQKEPIVFVSAPAAQLGTAQDLIARSAEDADAVPLGTPPPGSPPHFAALRLQAVAGSRLNIVAFPSAEAARQAALAGNVAAAALGLATAIGDLGEERLVGLGVAAKNRAEALPDLPTLRDSGLELSAFIRRGLVGPAGMGAGDIVAALQTVVADEEFRAAAVARGFVATWIDGALWRSIAQAEREELAKLWETEPWLQAGDG